MERKADRTRQRQPLQPLLVEYVTNRWEHARDWALVEVLRLTGIRHQGYSS